MSEQTARIAGGMVVALALLSGGWDLAVGVAHFDEMLAVTPGDPLPNFSAKLDDGQPFEPATLDGQVSLLTFWATWCHACTLEMPTIAALDRHYEGHESVRIYGINRDSGPIVERRRAVEAYLRQRELSFPQVYDNGQLASAFGVEQIPYLVIVDKHGQIRHLHLGQVAEATLIEELDTLAAEH